MNNILITGGLGFIGFNAVQRWITTYPNYKYFIVDLETYAATYKLTEKLKWCNEQGIQTFKANICDEFSIESIINQYKIDTIINFAAESHVDNSIKDPTVFYKTNVLGVVNLLNLTQKYNLRFHQISTDEVYGETFPDSWDEYYDSIDAITDIPENKRLCPSSPYASSKASADLIILSYCRTFNINATISRCSNNFGPWQHPEKLIGTTILNALNDKQIPVYGKGNQHRHWIYVDEHNDFIMKILHEGEVGKVYNIAPPKTNWISNISLIKFILKTLNKPTTLISNVSDRLGHDVSYFIVAEFAASNRYWKKDMLTTIEWYKENI